MWTVVELTVGIVVACLPSARILVVKYGTCAAKATTRSMSKSATLKNSLPSYHSTFEPKRCCGSGRCGGNIIATENTTTAASNNDDDDDDVDVGADDNNNNNRGGGAAGRRLFRLPTIDFASSEMLTIARKSLCDGGDDDDAARRWRSSVERPSMPAVELVSFVTIRTVDLDQRTETPVGIWVQRDVDVSIS